MAKYDQKRLKTSPKDLTNSETRKKLGLTQAQLAALLGINREQLAMAETRKRDLDSQHNALLSQMFLHFYELENGIQATYRSLETRLFLNDAYKKEIPKMRALEKEYRAKITRLSKEMEALKAEARDAENSIIVFTTAAQQLEEKAGPGDKDRRMLEGLQLFKQKAYLRLLHSWEPVQAVLQSRIESLAAEARVLRRVRLKILREQQPFKK